MPLMPLTVWVAAAALASSVPIAWWAVASGRGVTQRVGRNLAEYQPTMRQATLERSATQRVVLPVMKGVGNRLLRFTPVGWVDAKATALAKAGWTGRSPPSRSWGPSCCCPCSSAPSWACGCWTTPRSARSPWWRP